MAQPASGPSKAYELRIYAANAGKLADFQTLFRNRALPLFSKYGIDNVFDGAVLEGARIDGADAANMLFCIGPRTPTTTGSSFLPTTHRAGKTRNR